MCPCKYNYDSKDIGPSLRKCVNTVIRYLTIKSHASSIILEYNKIITENISSVLYKAVRKKVECLPVRQTNKMGTLGKFRRFEEENAHL